MQHHRLITSITSQYNNLTSVLTPQAKYEFNFNLKFDQQIVAKLES